ncbi:DUF4391 domain-containing protein [Methanobacterium sp.]|uniref:DUF4391 domain-containing protein n=1 Tax=Methanobacterium sp. TaxID=2164 RepID=UPI00315835F4
MFNIYEYMNIPAKCELGSTIFKKNFYENAKLNKSDKELFIRHVDKIKWDYCLKPTNISIKTFKDDIREYSEIEFITVKIKIPNKTKRLAEIIMRSIPYPMIIVFENENKIQIFTAHQRINLADNNKNTIEEFISTEWIDLDNLDDPDKKLFESLSIKNLSFTNFYIFYKDIIDNIVRYNASKLTGKDIEQNVDKIKKIYDDIKLIDAEIELIKGKIKKETQFNRQMEMNMQIKELEEKKEQMLNELD